MSRITEIKVKEIQKMSSQSTANMKLNKPNFVQAGIKNREFMSSGKVNRNNLPMSSSVNLFGEVGVIKSYRKEGKEWRDKINLKDGNLMTTKSETIQLGKEVSGTEGGKLSKFLLKNNGHHTNRNYSAVKNKLNENHFEGGASVSMANRNGLLNHNFPKTPPPRHYQVKSEMNTCTPCSPITTIRFPGERSENPTRNTSTHRDLPNINVSNKSVSPIATFRVNIENNNLSTPNRFTSSGQRCFTSTAVNNPFTHKDSSLLFKDIMDDSFSVKNVLFNQNSKKIDFEFGENIEKEPEFLNVTLNGMDIHDQSLLSVNKDLIKGKGGKIEFHIQSPVKKNYSDFKKVIDVNKVLLIQSVWRGHGLRRKLYNTLFRYYTGIAFINHIKRLKSSVKRNVFTRFFKNLRDLSGKIKVEKFLSFKAQIISFEKEEVISENRWKHLFSKNAVTFSIIKEKEKISNLYAKSEEFCIIQNDKKEIGISVEPFETFDFMRNIRDQTEEFWGSLKEKVVFKYNKLLINIPTKSEEFSIFIKKQKSKNFDDERIEFDTSNIRLQSIQFWYLLKGAVLQTIDNLNKNIITHPEEFSIINIEIDKINFERMDNIRTQTEKFWNLLKIKILVKIDKINENILTKSDEFSITNNLEILKIDKEPLIPFQNAEFSIFLNNINLQRKSLEDLTIEDIKPSLKQKILSEYINDKIEKFQIINNSSLDFNISELNKKAQDFSKFIEHFNKYLKIESPSEFNFMKQPKERIIPILISNRDVELNFIHHKRNLNFSSISQFYKQNEFSIFCQLKLETGKNDKNQQINTSPFEIKEIVDKQEDPKKRLKDVLNKRKNKGQSKFEVDMKDCENKIVSTFKKSSKIMRIAKLLEVQMLQKENSEVEDKPFDGYTKILFEKPIEINKKKPKLRDFSNMI